MLHHLPQNRAAAERHQLLAAGTGGLLRDVSLSTLLTAPNFIRGGNRKSEGETTDLHHSFHKLNRATAAPASRMRNSGW
jgi:hypothetical protein